MTTMMTMMTMTTITIAMVVWVPYRTEHERIAVVKVADEDDYKKLQRVMAYLYATLYLPLILGVDGSGNIYWYKDGAHAVHADMKGHTGLVMTLGCGAVLSASWKQKINSLSSTETETIAISDGMPRNMWCLYFTEAQDWDVTDNLLNEDNTSTMKLAKHGKRSSGKQTRHIKIRYFFVTDKIKAGEVKIVHCPTADMIADFFTKSLQGSQFRTNKISLVVFLMKKYPFHCVHENDFVYHRLTLAILKRSIPTTAITATINMIGKSNPGLFEDIVVHLTTFSTTIKIRMLQNVANTLIVGSLFLHVLPTSPDWK
mmetsp:Transcript_51838/g.58801  ORF Transcript_51838/g.58801 Transcript_51838/m.58801 type:complete len:314 (+) Transcript_51838:3-944(+)